MPNNSTESGQGIPESRKRDLGALHDLQNYLNDILASEEATDLRSSFKPLTDGLGLESPKGGEKKSAPSSKLAPPPPPTAVSPRVQMEERLISQPWDDADVPLKDYQKTSPPPVPTAAAIPTQEKSLAAIMEAPPTAIHEIEVGESALEFTKSPHLEPPPPLPEVTLLKRALAALLDQIFVITLWAIAITVTANLQTGFEVGLSSRVINEFANPEFLRWAALEFGIIWLAYLCLCFGILDASFGMWVWGAKVSYGNPQDENYGLRRVMRIFWGFVFYAPMVTLLLLVFRKNGRNILDTLSGSNLYLSNQH